MTRRSRFRTLALMAAVLLAALTLIGSTTSADTTPAQIRSQVVAEALAAPSVFLSYQGRLLDSDGNPKPDGDYLMSFSLYNVATLGSPLWTETKNVPLKGGLFSTLLGDSTAFDLTIFSGQALWLGVTVAGDPETSPRMPVTYVPYAVYAGNANTLGGQPRDAYAAAVHNHDASNIVSGNLPLERYHAADNLSAEGYLGNAAGDIALNNGVKQVNLVADMLDGQHNTDFAPSIHNHDATAITSGALSTDRFSAYADLAAEAKIGEASGQVAAGNHIHDARYYTESESDARFVRKAGDTMTGALAVPRIAYTAPRTQYFVVGGEGFVPGSDVAYINTYGNGGAYIVSGGGALVAPVHLPQGAQVTEFKVFFYDVSTSNTTVYLDGQGMSGGYFAMAQVSSTGISGYGSSVTTSISGNPIDNTSYSYCIYAWSDAWDGGNLRIKGALITYTISEAP